jgi:hypothetical protein
MVQFVSPEFKRDPYNLAGVKVIKKRTSSLRRRKAILEDRIREMQQELKGINEQLDKL